MTFHDEVDIDEMDWNDELKALTYQCPCGDLFAITLDELADGEYIARCPSCSLYVVVVYEPEDVKRLTQTLPIHCAAA